MRKSGRKQESQANREAVLDGYLKASSVGKGHLLSIHLIKSINEILQ